MAKCQECGKKTTFGHSRSFSMHATNRKFRPNLQRVSVTENGLRVKKVLCTRCIRTLSKIKTKKVTARSIIITADAVIFLFYGVTQ